jgi:tRNA pseudouridine32 synthase/23S rRNA pseudouridine746 synthase
VCEPGTVNAETLVELISPDGLYRLTPRTGRTHQLRVHMTSLGVPIMGDPLYPSVVQVSDDDFSAPLQLLAQRIEFDDPRTGLRREFISRRAVGTVYRSEAGHVC